MSDNKKSSTDDLLKTLSNIDSTTELLKFQNELKKEGVPGSFCEYISSLAAEHCLAKSELIAASGIDRTYGYQILDGRRRAGRDRVLALCLAAQCSLDQAQRCLTLAGHGRLYAREPRDSAIIYAVEKHRSVIETNSLLDELGFDALQGAE